MYLVFCLVVNLMIRAYGKHHFLSCFVLDPGGSREIILCSHLPIYPITPSSPMLVPLLCMSTSIDIVASLNIHGVQTSFSLTMLSLLLVSLLETLLLTLCLFNNLSPSMLLFRTTLFPTHPPGAVSLLLFLGLTPHLSPLSIFFLLYYNFLNSNLLAYLLSLSLL